MENQLDLLLKEDVFKQFYEISQIPRESGNEKAISDYVYHLMSDNNLECYQDDLFNLIIKKAGQGKGANSKPLILQAHLDMVCVKTENSTHNFLTDAIGWKIDGDWISSDNGTSLGADCGIGSAVVMAVLLSKEISHPPIEAVFTTREETDMAGAYGIDAARLTANRMINFDISPDNKLLAGSCGGAAIEFLLPLTLCDNSEKSQGFVLSIEGMQGGHSGANINSGRGNGIVLLARALQYIKSHISYELVSFDGGSSRLAIPTAAKSVITVLESDKENLVSLFNEFLAKVHDEIYSYAPEIKVILKEVDDVPEKFIEQSSASKLISTCLMLPIGIQEMNYEPKNTVESSCNLGVVQTNGDTALFISEVRSSHKSTRELIILKYQTIAQLLGAKIHTHSEYASWKYCSSSHLRDVITKEYKDLFHEDMNVAVAHAGNEIGILYDKIQGLDAVAMGPTRERYHTTNEVLSIKSVRSFYQFLKNALSNL